MCYTTLRNKNWKDFNNDLSLADLIDYKKITSNGNIALLKLDMALNTNFLNGKRFEKMRDKFRKYIFVLNDLFSYKNDLMNNNLKFVKSVIIQKNPIILYKQRYLWLRIH